MSERLKGILDIKVYDKDGKLKQHETEENMITNASLNILKNEFTSPDLRILRGNNSISPALNSNLISHFEGILLFNELLVENKDNYFKQLLGSEIVGHGDSNATALSSSKYGLYNETISEITDTSITKQWNFGEGKGVGTIKSVALTNNNLGRLGTYDDETKATNTNAFFIDNKIGPASDGIGIILVKFPNESDYTSNPNMSSPSEYVNFCGYKDGVIYGYKTSVAGGVRTTEIYTFTLSNFYKKNNFSNKLCRHNTYNEMFRLYSDTITPVATITTSGDNSAVYDSISFCQYESKIYFLVRLNYNRYLYYFDMTNNTTTQVSTIAASTLPSGHDFRWYSFCKNSLGIFISDTTKIARFTDNLVFVNNIEIPSSLRTSDTAKLEISLTQASPDGTMKIANEETISRTIRALTNLTDYNFISSYGNLNMDFLILDEFNGLYALAYSRNAVYLYHSNMYISTIKNLKVPVVKGETDEMVVTYKIIKQET